MPHAIKSHEAKKKTDKRHPIGHRLSGNVILYNVFSFHRICFTASGFNPTMVRLIDLSELLARLNLRVRICYIRTTKHTHNNNCCGYV